jgi:hypothetical protein
MKSNAFKRIMTGLDEALVPARGDAPEAPRHDPRTIEVAIQKLTTDVAGLRDDMRVLAATVMRLDNTQAAMKQEIRALQVQCQHMAERIRRLESVLP